MAAVLKLEYLLSFFRKLAIGPYRKLVESIARLYLIRL